MKKKVIKRAYGYAILSVQGGESMKATILLAEDGSGLAHAARDETGREKLNPGSMSASSDARRGAFLYNRKKA